MHISIDNGATTIPGIRAVLETGRRLKNMLGRKIEPDELVACFAEENIDRTLNFIKSEFDEEEFQQAHDALHTRLKKYPWIGMSTDAPFAVQRNLEYKSTQPYYTS